MSKNSKKIEHLEKELFSDRERMEIWIAENWKKCIYIAGATVVAVVAIFAGISYSNKRNAAAAAALSGAEADALPAVIEKYAGHPAEAIARIRLARALQDKKDYTAAKEQYKKVLSMENCADFLRSSAALEAAFCEELSGNDKAGCAAFAAIEADSLQNAAVRAEAGYHAGRLLIKLGDFAKAETLLKRLSVPMISGGEVWAFQSAQLLAALKNGEFKIKK